MVASSFESCENGRLGPRYHRCSEALFVHAFLMTFLAGAHPSDRVLDLNVAHIGPSITSNDAYFAVRQYGENGIMLREVEPGYKDPRAGAYIYRAWDFCT